MPQQLNNECTWCTLPVKDEGDTCDPQCYLSWIVAVTLGGSILAPDEAVPKDLTDQPWYATAIGVRTDSGGDNDS